MTFVVCILQMMPSLAPINKIRRQQFSIQRVIVRTLSSPICDLYLNEVIRKKIHWLDYEEKDITINCCKQNMQIRKLQQLHARPMTSILLTSRGWLIYQIRIIQLWNSVDPDEVLRVQAVFDIVWIVKTIVRTCTSIHVVDRCSTDW